MKQLIQKLTETFSPSGYEAAIREVILAEIQPLADEVRVDALSVDVVPSGDTPRGWNTHTALGKGPAVLIKDSGLLVDSRIVAWMTETAEKAHIPYQRNVQQKGGTDAQAMQLTRAGVLAGSLGIPTRYAHSPSEMIDINDVENAVKLLTELLNNPIQLD